MNRRNINLSQDTINWELLIQWEELFGDGSSSKLYHQIIRDYKSNNNRELEINLLKLYIELRPEDTDQYYNLSEILYSQNKFEEGCEILSNAIKNREDMISLDPPEMKDVIYNFKDITSVFYHALGLDHHNLKNYTTAINYFTLALEKFEKGGYENNLSLYYYDRAQAYAENGNIIMALRDLKAARNFDYEYAYNNISKEDKYELLNLIEKSIKIFTNSSA